MKIKPIPILILFFGFFCVRPGLAAGTHWEEFRKSICTTDPIEFICIRPPNPWSRNSNVNLLEGKLHRLFVVAQNPELQGNARCREILILLNDPKNERLLTLRRAVHWLRQTILKNKVPQDAYALSLATEHNRVYLQTSNLFGETGPMTHINVPNLILPESWAEKNFHNALISDGKIVWGYLSLPDSPQRTLNDLISNRKLLENTVIHLGLRLVEAEARGQRKGLEAHMGAHTGPEVNLAFGATWCENRAFYEGWALALRALLTEQFPRIFIEPDWHELQEKDRFLVYARDPWSEGNEAFEPLKSGKKHWNSPQGPLSSHWINANFLVQLFLNRQLENPFQKALEVLTKKGSPTLRRFFEDWLELYPKDREALIEPLIQATHYQNPISPFSCVGEGVWIGIPPKFDHVNFNASSAEAIKGMLSRLSEGMPISSRQTWIHPQNKINLLSDALVSERPKRCKQFKDIQSVTHFITAFADENGIARRAVMDFLKVINESKVSLDQFYVAERHRLQLIGAY